MSGALRVGLVGAGFMGRAHTNAFRQVSRFFEVDREIVLKAVCTRSAATAEAFAANWGYETIETDWRRLIERPDVDVIDIASPNDTHFEIATAAAAAGKIVFCEKPLGRDPGESRAMVEAVERAGVANMVWYNYRRAPAVTLAKQIIGRGDLGRIFHYRAKFLQDWTISAEVGVGGSALWRLDAAVAGSGVTGDLLAHCIDTALWLNSDMEEVSALTATFIKERTDTATHEKKLITIEDASLFLARFRNGSLGSFEATRYARGHKALNTFEINGEHASIGWDLANLHLLQYFDHRDPGELRGWRTIHVTDSDHPYMKNWWVPGLQIGYEHTFIHQLADFLRGQPDVPSFRDALATDLVIEAVLRSAATRTWVSPAT
jgi:myo-inositol 2-dehydrogenase/D-chiro-inositol 1-dehydrogenase